jgi:phospholipid/cholesterol/gamma-HCH transport system substrate-binding protein
MQKQAPSVGRILTMVVFALSCFGLMLFLWVSFGGAVPFKPEGYRFKVAFPEATTLGLEADVRIAGVSVGKVREKQLDPRGNRTLVTIEMDKKFAPGKRDSRAILRQKTLLGETYVELTPGTPGKPDLGEGAQLSDGRVVDAVQLDEIFNAFDPTTRQAFRTWQESLSTASKNRGQDLNDSFGNLPEFAASGSDLLDVLDSQNGAVTRLVSNTGVVFAALTQREDQLSNLITNSERTFSATASQRNALAEMFQIFPTFLDESRTTLNRLRVFSRDTRPLIRDLRPVMRDLRPTVADIRALAPDLRRLFLNLDPLVRVSEKGLPALRQTLRGTTPLLAQLGPFLSQLNPILQWLELNQREVSNFFSAGITGVSDETASNSGLGHYLKQFGPSGPETLAMYPSRLPTNRGNAYVGPAQLDSRVLNLNGITPNWDCKPSGGEKQPVPDGPQAAPGCLVQTPTEFQGRRTKYPQVQPDDYTKGR